jgi:hypothetical protein
MAMKETAETWIRIDLFCDGLGDDGICVRDVSDDLGTIFHAAPTAEGARKAILNAAIESRWTVDLKLMRWLCPECVAARDAGSRPPHLQAALEELHSSLVSNDPGPRIVTAAEIWRARGAADAAL